MLSVKSASAQVRLYAVRQLNADVWGIVMGSGYASLMFTVTQRQLRSWPVVQVQCYLSTGVWPRGFSRDSWRAAVITRLAAQRARDEGR